MLWFIGSPVLQFLPSICLLITSSVSLTFFGVPYISLSDGSLNVPVFKQKSNPSLTPYPSSYLMSLPSHFLWQLPINQGLSDLHGNFFGQGPTRLFSNKSGDFLNQWCPLPCSLSLLLIFRTLTPLNTLIFFLLIWLTSYLLVTIFTT